MQMDKLRMIVGFSIISSHLVTFIIILFALALTVSEKQELSLLIAPIFTVYVVGIVKKFVDGKPWDETLAHPSFIILALGAGILFSIAAPLIVGMFKSGSIPNFPDLKTYLGLVEGVLGLYTGMVVDKLFGSGQQDQSATSGSERATGSR